MPPRSVQRRVRRPLLTLDELGGMRPDVLREAVKERILKSARQRDPLPLVVVALLIEIRLVEPAEVKQVVALAKALPTGTALMPIALLTKLPPPFFVAHQRHQRPLVVAQNGRVSQAFDGVPHVEQVL